MIAHPRPGRRVTLAYRPALRPVCPHGASGRVLVAGNGRPRSHLVELDDGRRQVVPAGHLMREKSPTA